MALVATDPTQLPRTLSIGTRHAYDTGKAYHYRFVDEFRMYVCDHQTTTSAPGEVMAVRVCEDQHGTTWYVAQEGELIGGTEFRPRQIAFRTTERFWEPGKHAWELNANSSSTNRDDSSWGGTMSAITKVPEDVLMITAAGGHLAIADA